MKMPKTKNIAFGLIAVLVLAGAGSGYIAPSKVSSIIMLCAIGGAFAAVLVGLVITRFGVAHASLVGTAIAIYLALFALGVVAGTVPNVGGIAVAMVVIVVTAFVLNEAVGKFFTFQRTDK